MKKVAGRQILEHRFVVEQAIGRRLNGRHEQVHHLDGDKSNNELSNLEVVSPKVHAVRHGRWKYPETKRCDFCGREFTPSPTKRWIAITCSKECRYARLSLINRRPDAPRSIYRPDAYPCQAALRKPISTPEESHD